MLMIITARATALSDRVLLQLVIPMSNPMSNPGAKLWLRESTQSRMESRITTERVKGN